MPDYNLLGEIAALIIVTIILSNFHRDYEKKTIRVMILKILYLVIFASIVITIISSVMLDIKMFQENPWTIEVANFMYYLFVPLQYLFFAFFVLSLTKIFAIKNKRKMICTLMAIPYVVYIGVVTSNFFTGIIFTISATGEYFRGEWYLSGYIIGGLYSLIVIILALTNLSVSYRDAKLPIAINIGIVLSILSVQLVVDDVITTGIASVAGILFIHLSVHNIYKSTDQLTGIPNKLALTYKINECIKKEEHFELYVLKLNNFKNVNAKLGTKYGDTILIKIARYFGSYFTTKELFRYSGNKFAILITSKTKISRDEVDDRVLQIINGFEDAFEKEKLKYFIELLCAKVGYPNFGNSTEELFSAIEYSFQLQSENEDKSNFISDINVLDKMRKRVELEKSLKEAIYNKSFEVHYQPIYDLENNTFTEAEALVRMVGSDGMLVYPSDFIEILEKNGSIVELTYIVLEKVCQDIRTMLDKYGIIILGTKISVNFSYHNFLKPDMIDNVMEILTKYDISPETIKIEITERTLITNVAIVNETIDNMKKIGFEFELDDFGIDYSNFNLLLDMRVDLVKIDRALLVSASSSKTNFKFFQKLIKAIVSIGKTIVVEGAETIEDVDFIRKCDCKYVQGFFFSKPKPFDKFEDFLLDSRRGNIDKKGTFNLAKILKDISGK